MAIIMQSNGEPLITVEIPIDDYREMLESHIRLNNALALIEKNDAEYIERYGSRDTLAINKDFRNALGYVENERYINSLIQKYQEKKSDGDKNGTMA